MPSLSFLTFFYSWLLHLFNSLIDLNMKIITPRYYSIWAEKAEDFGCVLPGDRLSIYVVSICCQQNFPAKTFQAQVYPF